MAAGTAHIPTADGGALSRQHQAPPLHPPPMMSTYEVVVPRRRRTGNGSASSRRSTTAAAAPATVTQWRHPPTPIAPRPHQRPTPAPPPPPPPAANSFAPLVIDLDALPDDADRTVGYDGGPAGGTGNSSTSSSSRVDAQRRAFLQSNAAASVSSRHAVPALEPPANQSGLVGLLGPRQLGLNYVRPTAPAAAAGQPFNIAALQAHLAVSGSPALSSTCPPPPPPPPSTIAAALGIAPPGVIVPSVPGAPSQLSPGAGGQQQPRRTIPVANVHPIMKSAPVTSPIITTTTTATVVPSAMIATPIKPEVSGFKMADASTSGPPVMTSSASIAATVTTTSAIKVS